MQQLPDVSQARQALLAHYLRGDIAPNTSTPLSGPTTQANPGEYNPQPRATMIQSGKTHGTTTKTPFFFLHGDWTGNGIFCYKLARDLGADQPFYALDTYAFEHLSVLPDLETVAAEQLKMIREVQPEGPYLLGGFCNGALIAYEMARQLQSVAQTVDLLVLIDAIPPRYQQIRTTIERLSSFLQLSQETQLACFLRLQHLFRMLIDRGQIEDYDFLKLVDPRITHLFPPVETLRKEFAAMFIWATSLYTPNYYSGKVTLLWDEAEPIRATWWQHMALAKDAKVESYNIPGTHESCKTEHIDGMAERILLCLQQVQQERPTS